MMKEPNSIQDLISRWKTIGEFAADTGCGYEAARKMMARGRIAPRNWPAVVDASHAKGVQGVTIEWLASQHTASLTSPRDRNLSEQTGTA